MRAITILLAAALVGCGGDQPPAPSSQESGQLNEAEAMLDALSNEEGPEQSPGPSNRSN